MKVDVSAGWAQGDKREREVQDSGLGAPALGGAGAGRGSSTAPRVPTAATAVRGTNL